MASWLFGAWGSGDPNVRNDDTKVDGKPSSAIHTDDKRKSSEAPSVNEKDVEGPNETNGTEGIKLEAIFDYDADPKDSAELSVKKGDAVDVIRRVGFWWVVRKDSGEQGLVPSNYFGPMVIDRARAKYKYDANPDDPNEISFKKGDIFEVTRNACGWWSVKTRNGVRIVPSKYVESEKEKARTVDQELKTTEEQQGVAPSPCGAFKDEGFDSEDFIFGIARYKARALYSYTADPSDDNEYSFKKGDIMEIFDISGKWWSMKTPDGTMKIAPSNYLQLL